MGSVRLIDAENKQIGIVSINEAMEDARRKKRYIR